jgi:hypothetical protein
MMSLLIAETVYALHYVEFYFIFFLSVVGLNELAEQVDQTKQVSLDTRQISEIVEAIV